MPEIMHILTVGDGKDQVFEAQVFTQDGIQHKVEVWDIEGDQQSLQATLNEDGSWVIDVMLDACLCCTDPEVDDVAYYRVVLEAQNA